MQDGFGARTDAQFGVEVAQVKFHRPHRELQGKRNFFVALALKELFDDLLFAWGEGGLHAPKCSINFKAATRAPGP